MRKALTAIGIVFLLSLIMSYAGHPLVQGWYLRPAVLVAGMSMVTIGLGARRAQIRS